MASDELWSQYHREDFGPMEREKYAARLKESSNIVVIDPEMAEDIRAYDEAKKAIAEGEELIPSEVTYALLDGANPVRVWREYRGLTQQQLAQSAGISVPYLSQIESGKRAGSTEVLASLARGLARSLDDLVVI
jgi:DNA-binding XRE family transcriptional regulator